MRHWTCVCRWLRRYLIYILAHLEMLLGKWNDLISFWLDLGCTDEAGEITSLSCLECWKTASTTHIQIAPMDGCIHMHGGEGGLRVFMINCSCPQPVDTILISWQIKLTWLNFHATILIDTYPVGNYVYWWYLSRALWRLLLQYWRPHPPTTRGFLLYSGLLPM